MISAIFLSSLILTVICLYKKREWKKVNEKAIRYFFYDKCAEFFGPLLIVSLFYSILSLSVDGTTDKSTLGWLENLENVLESIKGFVSYFKLKPWYAVLAILALLVVDLIISFILKPTDFASCYKTYHTWSKRVYTVVVLLGSFTFFGNQTGEQIAHLRIRTDKIKAGYAEVQEQAEEMLSASVKQKLYEKIIFISSPDTKDLPNYPKDTGDAITSLGQNYEVARKLRIIDSKAVEVIKNYEAYEKPPANLSDKPIRFNEPKTNKTDGETKISTQKISKNYPPDLSVESVGKSISEIKTVKSTRPRVVSLLRLNGVKELLCQFPKSLTEVVKSAVFKEAIKTYPILEPIADVLVGTFDKSVEEKVKASADKVADSLVKQPQKAEKIVAEEAQKIVDAVEVKASPNTLEKIRNFAGKIKNRLEEIGNVNAKISSLSEAAQAKETERVERAETARRLEEERRQRIEDEQLVKCWCVSKTTGISTYVGIRKRWQCRDGTRC